MASSKLRSGLDWRVVLAPAASNTGVLPLDAVYEILLRLPAKELCRLRTVCRVWRSLLSDPHFAAAHAARQQLIMVSYFPNAEHDMLVDIIDLSGQIVKRVYRKEGYTAMSVAHDLVWVMEIGGIRCRFLNPATGAVYHLSDRSAEEHAHFNLSLLGCCDILYVFGQIANTGEYKVLRRLGCFLGGQLHQLFEVCTLKGGSHAMWRGKQAPPQKVAYSDRTNVVIDGVVYFLSRNAHHDLVFSNKVSEEHLVITFDLETEAWGPTLRGPHISFPDNGLSTLKQLTLASLNDTLAIVYGPVPNMDIWILMDSEKDLWVKQYSIKVEQYDRLSYVHPLLVLDDGRVVIYVEDKGLLQIYNPRRNTFKNVVELEHCSGISMYTGSLLNFE